MCLSKDQVRKKLINLKDKEKPHRLNLFKELLK